jgi:hypothetical protein
MTKLALIFTLLLSFPALAKERVYFVEPKDGAEVTSPFKVKFGLEGMKIGPLGDLKAGIGHHHLVVDGKPIEKEQVVPADEKHLHYGKGQTEAEITLPPGEHTLTLQFADGAHRSYGKDMSESIKVKVKTK